MEYLICGDKVKLREAIPEDAELLCKWYSDGNVMVHVGFPNGLDRNVHELREHLAKKVSINNLFIILNEENIPIGECSYNNLDKEKCNIGIKICELIYQGKGYGEDTIITFINYLFRNYSLKHIDLDTLIENTRAQNLYRKIGFKDIGIDSDCWGDPIGRSRSAINMTLLKEEFYNKKAELKLNFIKEEILRLEKELLKAEIRKSVKKINDILANDFIEFCSSGKEYHYKNGDVFQQSDDKNLFYGEILDFQIKELSDNCILAMYKINKHNDLKKEKITTLRSSIWKLIDSKWRMVFHQGTPIKNYE